MPAPANSKELTDIILKSGVIEEAKLRAQLKKLADSNGPLPNEPAKLAALLIRDGVITTFQSEQLLQGKWKRFFIGKYKVLEKIGVGGMGQVFLCEHKLMKRRVAIKVLPINKAQDESALARFYREARAVASVDHPNIVRAYDIDQDENLHFLVMEFVDGSNLHDIPKKNGPMDILRACHYIYGAAVGLQHAHEMGLVHRDIKPANILIDRSGVVKILDLGLARFFNPDDDDHLTKKFDENVLGTADYLAPEQAIDSTNVDIRADIYGLGGTLYYMLAGHPPYPDGSVTQKLLWHQTTSPKPIRQIRPEVPEALAAILDKMLARNREERYQTPADVMMALAPWVQTPIPPPPEHEMPRFSMAASGSPTIRPAGPGSAVPIFTGASSDHHRSLSGTQFKAPSPSNAQATAVKSQPKEAAAPEIWESITSSDTLPNAVADTDSAKKPKKTGDPKEEPDQKEKPKRQITKKKKSLTPYIIAAIVGFLVVGGAATALLMKILKPATTESVSTQPTTAEPKKWYVTSTGNGPDPAQSKKSLAEAISAARSGDTITILDDKFESPAVILGSRPIKGVRIEAGTASKSVTWVYKPSPNSSSKPEAMLEFSHVEDCVIEGITFDGTNQIDTGIRVTGNGNGVQMVNTTVLRTTKFGVQLLNINAQSKPLKIEKCRFWANTAIGLATFSGGLNIGIEIADSRLEGHGRGNGMLIDGKAGNIEVHNCRLYNFDNGVLIAGPPNRESNVILRFEKNTFHTMKQSGLAAEASLVSPGRTAQVSKNFFYQCKEIFKVPGPSNGVFGSNNGAFESAENNNANLKADKIAAFTFAPTNRENDAEFLRPAKGAKMPSAGMDKVTIGAE